MLGRTTMNPQTLLETKGAFKASGVIEGLDLSALADHVVICRT